jgi:hypothetical protein
MSNRLRAKREGATTQPRSAPRRSPLRYYGDEFVFDTVSGMFFRLSPTGSFVLRSLEAGVRPDDLPAAVAARFKVDRITAARDIELFLNDLAALEPLTRFAHA